MLCPKPQPGHQVMPIAFKGHKEKWGAAVGLQMAKASNPPSKKANSKYLRNSFFTMCNNFPVFEKYKFSVNPVSLYC